MAGLRLHLEVLNVGGETGAKMTCVHASNRFIVYGTNNGYARLFAVSEWGAILVFRDDALCLWSWNFLV